MKRKTNEERILINEDKYYKKVTQDIRSVAILCRVYGYKTSEEMLNIKVKNQLNAINYSINQINPKFVDKSKKYEKISNEILDTMNHYENNLAILCNYYDDRIEQLLFEKVELENKIIVNLILQNNNEKSKINIKKKVVQKINTVVDKIKNKIKKNDIVDVSIINKIKDSQDIAKEMNGLQKENKIVIDLKKKINEVNEKIYDLNQEKEKVIMSSMESEEKGLSVEVKRPKTIKRIKTFFSNKFNTYNVIMKNVINPINQRIELFKEQKLKNKALNEDEFKIIDFENKLKEIQQKILLEEIEKKEMQKENVG